MADFHVQQKRWTRIVAKAWADDGFKARLLADPVAVLREEGSSIQDGVDVKIIEPKENEVVLILPTKPADDKLLEQGEERLNASVWASICCVD